MARFWRPSRLKTVTVRFGLLVVNRLNRVETTKSSSNRSRRNLMGCEKRHHVAGPSHGKKSLWSRLQQSLQVASFPATSTLAVLLLLIDVHDPSRLNMDLSVHEASVDNIRPVAIAWSLGHPLQSAREPRSLLRRTSTTSGYHFLFDAAVAAGCRFRFRLRDDSSRHHSREFCGLVFLRAPNPKNPPTGL